MKNKKEESILSTGGIFKNKIKKNKKNIDFSEARKNIFKNKLNEK